VGLVGGALSGCVNAVQPVTLADHRVGVAWTDNASIASLDNLDMPRGDGLLHVALPGTAQPTPRRHSVPPMLSTQVLGPATIRAEQALRVRVSCRRGPCDVRAVANGYAPHDSDVFADATTLPAGHSAILLLQPDDGYALIKRRTPASATISLIACAPAGAVAQRLTLHPRFRLLAPRPFPRVLDPAARRHGNTIHVTWRTAQPAVDASFLLLTLPISAPNAATAGVDGNGRTRFSATLHVSPGLTVHMVGLSVGTSESLRNDTLKVPVR
jgi:hypothetical protein